MKICILANALSVHTQRWATAYAQRGHDVQVLSIRSANLPGVRVHTVCFGPINSASRIWTFLSYAWLLLIARRRLHQLAPDIVHAHYTVTHGVIAAFAGVRPILLSAWGSDVISRGPGLRSALLHLLNNFAIRGVDRVTATSKFMLERIKEMAPTGVPVVCTPFGVDTEKFSPLLEMPAHDARRPFRIGFLKSLKRIYGPDILLRATAVVRRQQPNVELIIIGSGPMESELRRLCKELDLEDITHFMGFIPNDEIPEVLCSLDLFINCSVVPESFGVAILEASACGIPVIASNVGGVPEVCRNGINGILIPPGRSDEMAKAICDLMADSGRRRQMGLAGRRFIMEEYKWCENVTGMIEHLKEVGGKGTHTDGVNAEKAVCWKR